MAEVTTQDKIPSYQQKKFVELENAGAFDKLAGIDPGLQIGNVANSGPIFTRGDNAAWEATKYFASKGLGGLTIGQLSGLRNDPNAVTQYGLGNSFSYEDLANEALQSDPFYDPADTQAKASFAQELEKRGLTNAQREDIKTLATQYSVTNQIDRAQNPGKYLDQGKKDENLATAIRLQKQAFGDDYSNPDEADYLAEQLAAGDKPYEIEGFLKTTPQYLKKQADAENVRVQEESAQARTALDAELLKGEEEAFARAQPQIISSFMKAGRLNSSGLQSAIAQARADLQKERQGFIANAAYSDSIRAQGYQRENFVNTNAQAFNQYLRQNEPAYQQRFNVQNAGNYATFQRPWENLNRQYQLNDQARARQYQVEDYNMQRNDYLQSLSADRRAARQNLPYQLLGGFGGAAIQGWASGGFK